MKTMNALRALAVLASGFAAASGLGCGPVGGGCGVVADPSFVDDAGVVAFNPTSLGASDNVIIPIVATADQPETITAAAFTGTGAGAFQLYSVLPLTIPAGGSANLEVGFTPAAAGSSSAAIVLEVVGMGEWPILLQGVGVAGSSANVGG